MIICVSLKECLFSGMKSAFGYEEDYKGTFRITFLGNEKDYFMTD